VWRFCGPSLLARVLSRRVFQVLRLLRGLLRRLHQLMHFMHVEEEVYLREQYGILSLGEAIVDMYLLLSGTAAVFVALAQYDSG
jgi:hypothetical protein